MRTPLPYYTFLLSALLILGCDGCDNNVKLTYSDNQCNAAPLVLTPLNIARNTYDLPTTACGDPLFEHQIKLPTPTTNDFFLQFENLTGEIFYRVYGMPTSGGSPVEIIGCSSSELLFPLVTGTIAPSQFEYLIVSVTRGTTSLSNFGTSNIKVTAYERRPRQQTINGTVAVNCDGDRTQRIVIGSCNPNAFVEAWAREQGLSVVDSLPFPTVGGLVVVELPPGIDPNSEPPSVPTEIKRDTVNYFTETDFLIRLSPVDLRPLSQVVTLLDNIRGRNPIDTVFFPDRFVGPSTCSALAFDPTTAPASTESGENLVVAVIDSGVDTVQLNELWNKHRHRQPTSSAFLQTDGIGYDFVKGDYFPNDELGHGTAVAGTILSNYQGTRPLTLHSYKIFDGSGTATYFGAITAIYAAIFDGADIINLSWGIPVEEMPQALRCAIDFADSRGVIVVTSAGNDGNELNANPQWPAAFAGQDTFPYLLTIGAYVNENNALSLASFSNYGSEDVNLAAYAAAETYDFRAGSSAPVKTGTLYGTSISAPLVTKELADILSDLPPGDTTAISVLLAQLQQQLQPNQTRNGGQLLPLQCSAVP